MRYENTNHGKIIIDDGKRLVLDCESCNKPSRRFELWIMDDGGILKHKGNIYNLETAAPTIEELPITPRKNKPSMVWCHIKTEIRGILYIVTWPINPDVSLAIQGEDDIQAFLEHCGEKEMGDVEECPDDYLELSQEMKRNEELLKGTR